MSADTRSEKVGRRHFLKLAGLSAASGGAALTLGKDDAVASEAEADGASGYRETDHVKTYYKLARF